MKLLATYFDPRYFPEVSNDSIYEYRQELKRYLLAQRKWKSDWSGKTLYQAHLHEGILTRADVPKSLKWQYRIFAEFNCFLLLPEEHLPLPPTREWCIQKAYQRYGEEAVCDWFYSLPFKIFPFKLPT